MTASAACRPLVPVEICHCRATLLAYLQAYRHTVGVSGRSTVTRQLREAIESSPQSRYEISKQTGINQSVLSRFVREETNLDGVNIDKLAHYLGLELGPVKRQRKGW